MIPWTAACQASLSFTMSWSLLKLMSIELVMPSNYLILCRPLLLLPSIFPSIIKVAIVIFSSVAQLWPTVCEPMACSTPGFPVHHQLPELAQTHVHHSLPSFAQLMVMPCNHLIFCRPLLLLPSIFPSIRVFSYQVAKVL